MIERHLAHVDFQQVARMLPSFPLPNAIALVPVIPSSVPLALSTQWGASKPLKAGTKYTPPVSVTCSHVNSSSSSSQVWSNGSICEYQKKVTQESRAVHKR